MAFSPSGLAVDFYHAYSSMVLRWQVPQVFGLQIPLPGVMQSH
jgi:hypothetical protein